MYRISSVRRLIPSIHQSKKLLSLFSNDGWTKLERDLRPLVPGTPIESYDHKYLLRNCEKEITQPLQGQTTGEIPKWVKGSLLQNGPGKFNFGQSYAKHWFDGSALIHKFIVKDGKATYECQFLQTEAFKRNSKANRFVVSEFTTTAEPDPCHTIFQRVQTMFTPFSTDNCTVSIYPIGGSLFALTETPKMHQLSLEKGNTVGMVDLTKKFEIVSQAAHPHVTEDGSVFNVSLARTDKGTAYVIYSIPSKQEGGIDKGKVEVKLDCTHPWNPSYMHSFGITPRYFIIVEQPLTLSIRSILFHTILKKSFSNCFRWKDIPVKFNLIERETGKKTTFTTDNFFFFHTLNQYEEDGNVVFDICTYNNPSVINSFLIDSIKGQNMQENHKKIFSGAPLRFVLPTNTEGSGNLVSLKGSNAKAEKMPDGTVHLTPEKLSDDFCELARFDYDKLGQKYRYFYGLDLNGKLIKVDCEKKKTVHSWSEEGKSPNEPIFIPSPNAKREDEGVLLVSASSLAKEEEVTLLILDSSDFRELSRTVFNTPSPVPKAIHGWFAGTASKI